ncbi:MAG: FHA domain-containing protein, partial [Hydrogeniiclostridium sp.]
HYYNSALHPTCPICAQGSIPPTEPFPATSAPGGTYTADPPYMAENPGFPRTEPVSVDRSVSTPSTPFQPTMIGGDLNVPGGVEPVVGWLVCVEGPMRGNDYRLHAGYNYIGRELGDVRISGDQQISRQNHAMVAFDDADGIYYAGPSAGRNLLKVNGKTVLNAVELNRYDIISIGTTKLMFVPLCGEHFSWKKE